jgi:predicted O-methyltransferase YrrM
MKFPIKVPQEFEDYWQDIDGIPGWLDKEEAEFLFKIAINTGEPVVELGAWMGRSTAVFASAMRWSNPNRKVLSIDTFEGSDEHQVGGRFYDKKTVDPQTGKINIFPFFMKNLEERDLLTWVDARRLDSAAAARDFSGAVGLLFVDADHRYEAISRDLDAWMPKLSNRGTVVLHDVGYWEGPTRAAADLLGLGFRRIGQARSALALRRSA